jgi:lipoprotein NlpI
MTKITNRQPVTGGQLLAIFLGVACGLFQPVLASAEFQRHYELGKDFLQRQEYKLAIKELDIAASAKATPAELSTALVDRGTAYSELKDYQTAIQDFDRAIALDGTSHLAYNNRGVVYFRQGIADKAISNFDRALALDGEDKFAAVNRAGAYLMTDRAAKLAPATEQWLEQRWQSDFAAQAAVLTVLAYLSGGDKTRADSLIQRSLKTLDKLHWPYQMLSYLGGKISAEKVVERAEDSTYELTQAQCYLGINAYIKGKATLDLARNKLEFVIKHGTTNSVEYWVGKFFMAKIAPPIKPDKTGKTGH